MSDDLQKENTQDCGCSRAKEYSSAAVDTSRRRFAAATMATPIVTSLISRPVWATACSISGALSGNLSGHDHEECEGRGCTPGFWKTHPEIWCNDCGGLFTSGSCVGDIYQGNNCVTWDPTGGTLWSDVFPAIAPAIGGNPTLLEVMLMHNLAGDEGTFQNHVVASLLNAFYGPDIYGSTVQQVIDFVNQAYMDGTWHDPDGAFDVLVKMNESDDCFLNAHGNYDFINCALGNVVVEGQCIPLEPCYLYTNYPSVYEQIHGAVTVPVTDPAHPCYEESAFQDTETQAEGKKTQTNWQKKPGKNKNK